MRNACRLTPCSASEHARASAGATHVLRDGDEADADEREEAAAVPARSGGGRRSHPSRGCSVKHALACPLTPARTHARCGRRRASLLTRAVLEGDWGDGPCRGSTLEKEGRRDREGEKESRMKVICRYSKQPQKRGKHREVQDWNAY